MVHWDDLKADTIDLFQEFKKHKIGWIGVGIITFMIIIGLLAPYMAPGVPEIGLGVIGDGIQILLTLHPFGLIG